MTVADNVGAGTEAVAISPSPPSSITSQGSGVSTNDDQDGEIGSHVERSDGGESLKQRDMRELQELLSKLNPMAEEFVPPSMTKQGGVNGFNGVNGGFFTVAGSFLPSNGFGAAGYFPVNEDGGFRRKKPFGQQGKRRMNPRTSMAQREDIIRRTVYVSDIDQQVVDCRICGDPNSVLRFAFIEFTDEGGARAALNLSGTMLGFYPVKVMPSKTAIAPVNPTFLPRLFFEAVCGEVHHLRLLGDYHHPTRIGFVEFVMAESAITALNCSGVIVGSLPIRSKNTNQLLNIISLVWLRI
ncbi:hypothetical protein DY000_02003006 [Brassica cretica]|uniref:RRM domain-containing protein n=1 Tax=Brassica cretica TaxID=69181 RepID=A0ABQ7CIG1_BRACR|nr:hypothetical protein DY000_02003006 [Brassica cretica]